MSFVNFACVNCKSILKKANDYNFKCEKCKNIYKSHDGVIDFLPKKLAKIKQIDAQTYTLRASEFKEEEALKMNRPEFCDILRKFPKDKSVFLELCGGSARHALNLMKDGYKVIESDIALGATKKARDFAIKLKIDKNGFFCLIDAENLPFSDNSLEGIFLISSLHHLPDPRKALKEIHRCLKKDGVLLIGYEPNTWHYYLFYPFYKLFKYIIRKRSKHAISLADDEAFGFSYKQLKVMIKGSGLSLLEIKPVDFLSKFYEQFIVLLNRVFNKKMIINENFFRFLKRVDQKIFKIPCFKYMALNWDVSARKI
ncbi:MAG: putative methyltransferase [Candidatus Peregrinibacteria bacterium GW2011_GWA2_33_10]|nr:MAG: putative methyltransferase [Candidatus Peregrinibacteria bacterium GW2011_GWA2_33_10]KKP38786.1 MAG: methyltransferase [Candidatus Peregrinibacteria bacterium GW2011_GWC2_33_13]OGJ50619.1 MAG: hypothetical protein A2229_04005 [Candidatus Peregrinibacteria bacterium RIFOXYA2_FULL_33_7]